MSVDDFDSQNKPASDNQQIAEELAALAHCLKENVVHAAASGDSFDQVERMVLHSVLQIGQRSMDLLLALQGDGDLGATCETSQGRTIVRSAETKNTIIRSIFGQHEFSEFTYAAGAKKAIALRPISARLSLPKRQWSFLLQEFSQMLIVDQAYDQGMKNLGVILEGRFAVDTAERINGELGQAASKFLDDLPAPDPDSEARLLVASADGKGVPLVKEDAEKTPAFEQAKKNPGNRRMATVASVYTVEPHPRTAEEIVAALFREEPLTEPPPRPAPQNKITTAHLPKKEANGDGAWLNISGIHVAMAWIMGQVLQRRRTGQVLIVLMDGQQSLWETIQLHLQFGPRTIAILDILHGLSYIWQAAALFTRDDASRREFTRQRLLRILRGEVAGVIQGLRSLATRRKLTGEQQKTIQRICGYLEKNADRMRYDEYLRRGYPIASGVIEGACRHLVKDRMERSGMRWTLEGARAMLNVRAAFQSAYWRPFLDNRAELEVAKTHPHRNLISNYTPETLAC
jgi:hypothetical protein